jgi:LPXTG-motif cell wall-anchored protein
VSAPAGSRWAYAIGLLVLLSAGGVLLIRLRRRNE